MTSTHQESYPYCYVVISPVRDEVDYIEYTLKSMINQSCKPLLWVIVNDGSTDGTEIILKRYSKKFNWIRVINKSNRGFRAPGTGVIEAFNAGYQLVKGLDWDFLIKLDGDLSFKPDYFEKCFNQFSLEKNLGIGGGTILSLVQGRMKIDSSTDPPFHVRGATKIYRNACWKDISPLIKAPGWDTVDEVKANFRGWATRTFDDLFLIQHKTTGSADGHWRNWYKNGLANYNTGYHPIFMFAKCLKRLRCKPYGICSVALLFGYCAGFIMSSKYNNDKEVKRYLHIEQLRRLFFKKSIYS